MAVALIAGHVRNLSTLDVCALLSTGTPYRYLNGAELLDFWRTGTTPTEQPR